MAAQNVLTFDLVPPRRPSLDDLGGAGKTNNGKWPPKPPTQPTAEEHNQWAQFLAYLGRSTEVARLSVHWTGSVYTISFFQAAPTGALATSFTIVRVGAGHVTIVCPPANGCVLPPPGGAPRFTANASASSPGWVRAYVDGSGNPGVEVTMAGDGDFSVDIL